MNKYLKKYDLIAWVSGVLLLTACNVGDLDFDNIQDPTLTPEVVAPVGEVTYTVKELIEEINDPNIELTEAKNMLLSVIYRDTSIFQIPEQLIAVNDLSQQKVVEHGINIPSTPVAVSESFVQTFSLDYPAANEERIDSILYASGDIEIIIESQVKADIDLQIKLKDFVHRETRDTIVYNASLAYNGVSPVNSQFSQSLENHRTQLTESGTQNLFNVEVSGTIHVDAGQSVSDTDYVVVTINTANTRFSSIIGYFGEDQITVQDQSIDIDFFKDIEPLGLEFNTPEIVMEVENSFGLPLGVSFDGLSTVNANGDTRTLTGMSDPTPLRAPSIDEFGESLRSSITISSDNTNLRELLSISPTRINVPITAFTNLGNAAKEANFYTENSRIETYLEVNMPLDVKLGGYKQTLDFDVDPIDFEEADSLKLRLKTINDLPFNGAMNLYLLNADSVVIHEVPDNIILQSPEVGSNGRITESKTHVEDIPLNNDGVKALKDCRKIALVLQIDSFEAQNDQFVKIYSDYTLQVKVGVIANLNYKP